MSNLEFFIPGYLAHDMIYTGLVSSLSTERGKEILDTIPTTKEVSSILKILSCDSSFKVQALELKKMRNSTIHCGKSIDRQIILKYFIDLFVLLPSTEYTQMVIEILKSQYESPEIESSNIKERSETKEVSVALYKLEKPENSVRWQGTFQEWKTRFGSPGMTYLKNRTILILDGVHGTKYIKFTKWSGTIAKGIDESEKVLSFKLDRSFETWYDII